MCRRMMVHDHHVIAGLFFRQLTICLLLSVTVASEKPNWEILFGKSFDGVNHEFITAGLSSQCCQRFQSLNINERWKYVDASGKPGSGIFGGNIQWFGSFDECLKISESRYCLATVAGNFGGNMNISILYGICVPNECNNKDVATGFVNFFHNVTHHYFPTLHLDSRDSDGGVHCYEEPSYTGGVILTILFCSLVLLMCVIGTTIEVIQESTFHDNYNKPAALVTATSTGTTKLSVSYNNDNEIVKMLQQDETTPLLGKTKEKNGLNGVIAGHNLLTERIKKQKEIEQTSLLKPEEGREQPQSVVIDFFLCFSLLRNTRKVFNTDVTPSMMTSLNGIRVISLFWVILGHTFIIAKLSGVVENTLDIRHDQQTLSMMVITNAFFSVDTFFFLSGLLLAYNAFKRLKNSDGRLNLRWFYLHRYLRLTPTLMFVILFVAKIEPLVDKSPLWFSQVNDQRCNDYWWTNMLYINNFYPTNTVTDTCVPWTWYTALDMQFFVITPIIIWLISRYGYRGLVGTSMFLILGSTITIAVIINHYDFNPMAFSYPVMNQESIDLFNKVYAKPYCRIQPYIIGLVFGYLIHIKLFREKGTGWALALLSWGLAIIVGLCLVYAPNTAIKKHPHSWTKFEKILYASVRHFLWGILLVWVTYACEYGYGGYVKEFLSSKFWIPLTRLTYSAYLIHYQLLVVMFVGYRTGLHYTKQLMAYFFCAALVLSYALGFILVVVIEFPCVNIEMMMMRRKTRHGNS